MNQMPPAARRLLLSLAGVAAAMVATVGAQTSFARQMNATGAFASTEQFPDGTLAIDFDTLV